MVVVRPFAALRPTSGLADKVAVLPMGMMNSEEARRMAAGNPYSFLHIDKAEIDLPPEQYGVLSGSDVYPDEIYDLASANLRRFEDEGTLHQDETPMFYIYRQQMADRVQTGLVVCASVDDYINNNIKKHEFTRASKEASCIRLMDRCNAHTGPIFLAYQGREEITGLISDWADTHQPVYDFTTANDVTHIVWVVDDMAVTAALIEAFAAVETLYVADGHHRAASSVEVAKLRRSENPQYDGSEGFNYFLATLFPADELRIMDYNRVVRDLNGMSEEAFLARLAEVCDIEPYLCDSCPRPQSSHTISMCLASGWYMLTVREGVFDPSDIMGRLDVSILQNSVLAPILGVGDPRTDERIDFVGGNRGLGELERRVQNGWAVAFAMYPPSIDDLMQIADNGDIMPPKSTWFEPKLLSGLFIHKFD